MTYILLRAFVGGYNRLQLYHFTPFYHTNIRGVRKALVHLCEKGAALYWN